MLLILLLLVPLLTALICIKVKTRVWLERINLAGFAILGALTIALARQVLVQGSVSAFNGFLYADALSALVAAINAFVAIACAIYAIGYFREDERQARINFRHLRRYYVLTPLFVGTMVLVVIANNLGIMWVAIESTTLASVLLVTFYNKKTSFEAGWKYIIIGSIGIALALFGTIITYYSAVHAMGENAAGGLNWSVLITWADKFDRDAMRLAFIMILLGYGTKAGLAPMHTWKPDAYEEAPVPTAAMLGAGFVNCAIYGIIRYHTLATKCLGHAFPENLLIGFGVGSILLAAPFILVQRNFRRILAYSSIDHAGIMVAAVGFGGKFGLLGAMLHMLYHGITKPLMFFCAGNVQQHYQTPYFRKVTGVIQTLPWTGAMFLLATFAITGMPPFGLFQSEFTALSGALAAGHYWAAGLFIAGVVTIFAGFLVHMAKLNLGAPREHVPAVSPCPWKVGATTLVAAAVIGIGFWVPGSVMQLVQQAAALIGGYS